MTTFILVHGALHGGWCWDKVVLELANMGHTAFAPDLPGIGQHRVPPEDVTLALMGGFIADLAKAQNQRVVLVGHSLGGLTISSAAEAAPEAIEGLVYVSAVLLPSGGAASDLLDFSNLPEGLALSEDGLVLTDDVELARERYYNGCDEADVEVALARLVPQPVRPMLDKLALTSERFGSLPRAFIECVHDNALPLEFQRLQREVLPCRPVFSMKAGHSPFLQNSRELAAHLLSAAISFSS